jgi:hypothetical protein
MADSFVSRFGCYTIIRDTTLLAPSILIMWCALRLVRASTGALSLGRALPSAMQSEPVPN